MKRNKIILFIAVIIFFAGCSTQKNSASSNSETMDSVKKITVKNILIVGTGSTVSRVFLENLSEDMISVLRQAHVIGNFKFLENIKLQYQFDTSSLDSLEYDAYIVFLPLDKADLKLNQTNKIPLPLWNAYVYGVTSNSYKQTFALRTYAKTDKLKLIWEANFTADFDLTDKEKYKPITNDILATLYLHYFSSQ